MVNVISGKAIQLLQMVNVINKNWQAADMTRQLQNKFKERFKNVEDKQCIIIIIRMVVFLKSPTPHTHTKGREREREIERSLQRNCRSNPHFSITVVELCVINDNLHTLIWH